MPATALTGRKPSADSHGSSPNSGTAVRPNTRRNGPTAIPEELQDIKDSLEGRKFLEKHALLCPPGEPASHASLATCLHQISLMPGLQKPAINAIRSIAFLLDEMEDLQVNETIREAIDSQMTEFTSDMKLLIEDAKEKIDTHMKTTEERLANIQNYASTSTPTTQARRLLNPNSYASVLINPPAHANPRVAAREGIKARQFMLEGIKNSKFSHLDTFQLKTELNKIISDLGLTSGKIRSITSSRNGGTVIETDNDEAASWFLITDNQRSLCDKIGSNAEFRTRSFNIIAFNVSLAINPEKEDHLSEICEANDLEPDTITSAKWAKAIDKRSPTQRTAHLLITLNNAEAANRAITNGITICNRRCHVERTKREPIRCLKCQGWNHMAKECTEEKDSCGNCSGPHRTNSCLTQDKRCVSCKTDDHASWSRTCPTFLRKTDEYNSRNPDNLLQFFPTADPWTWSANDKLSPKQTLSQPPRSQSSQTPTPKLSKNQLEKRPQPPRRAMDSYIPTQPTGRHTDTYVPEYQRHSPPADNTNTTGWWGDPGPSNSRPLAPRDRGGNEESGRGSNSIHDSNTGLMPTHGSSPPSATPVSGQALHSNNA